MLAIPSATPPLLSQCSTLLTVPPATSPLPPSLLAIPSAMPPLLTVSPATAVVANRHETLRFCVVFSGPDRDDSLANMLRRLDSNCHVDQFDILQPQPSDLLCDLTWQRFLGCLKKRFYNAGIYMPPCDTFCGGRRGDGPSPLRSHSGPGRYGLPGLTMANKEKVRTGSLLAIRTAEALMVHLALGIPFIYETPWPIREGAVNMTTLDEFQHIIATPGVRVKRVDQCRRGAITRKPTLLILFLISDSNGQVTDESVLCNHPLQSWTIPWSGQTRVLPHPWLRGRQLPVLTSTPEARQRGPKPSSNVPFITAAAAAYPAGFNRTLACWLMCSASLLAAPPAVPPLLAIPSATTPLHFKMSFSWSARLRPGSGQLSSKQAAQEQAPRLLGGLRRAHSSVKRLSQHQRVGDTIRHCFCERMLTPAVVKRILDCMGSEDISTLPSDLIAQSTALLTEALSVYTAPRDLSVWNLCAVNVTLLDQWQRAAADPDNQPIDWLLQGAPAGLTQYVKDRGVFPLYSLEEDPVTVAAADLATEDGFANYNGVEESPEVSIELDRLEKAGHMMKFSSLAHAQKFVGRRKIVLSRIGLISKIRQGKTKIRIVFDSKRSLVSSATRRHERVILPRVTDTAADALDLMSQAAHRYPNEEPSQLLEFMVADFKDAFHIVPLHPEERAYFVVQLKDAYYVALKTTQGSRGAPLTWARLAALLSRLTQAAVGSAGRLSCYVDDPLLILLAPVAERQQLQALVLLLWSTLRLPLSLSKATRGAEITWTSAQIKLLQETAFHWGALTSSWGIQIRAKQSIVDEIRATLSTLLTTNVASVKVLRTFAGQLIHVSSLIQALRPFIGEIFGAICSAEPSNAPKGCIWTRQITTALLWLRAFLDESIGPLERVYWLNCHLQSPSCLEIVVDASPWGLGAFVCFNGVIQSFFASEIGSEEASTLRMEIGSCRSQQAAEALCVVVALRTWMKYWKSQRLTVRIRSDSVAALTLAIRHKAQGYACSILARELALDIATASFLPVAGVHIPGVSNVVTDALSRKFQPGKQYMVPECLSGVAEMRLEVRTRSFFRTLGAPPA